MYDRFCTGVETRPVVRDDDVGTPVNGFGKLAPLTLIRLGA